MVPIPAQIGPYRVLGVLGAGGMGSVFKAESREGQIVAVKMIGRPIDTRARFRPRSSLPAFNRSRRVALVREARLAMELTHPNILRVFDYGQHRGLLYLVMEFLEGRTLLSALRNEAPTLEQRLRWIAEVCDGLAYAHRSGVIHRDLHANNVFILHDHTVKLLDFGLARRVDDPVLPGQIAGVLPFLAPEILAGRARFSAATDMWSIGILLYLVLHGNLPFGRDRLPQFAAKVLTASSPWLDATYPCAVDLQDLLSRALESDPERRLVSAGKFATELRRIAAKAGQAQATALHQAIPVTASAGVSSMPMSVPVTAGPASVSVQRRTNHGRYLQERLATFDIASYLRATGMTFGFGLMLLGYLQPGIELPVRALGVVLALISTPLLLLFPANLLLTFAAGLTEVPRCRFCRFHMRRRGHVTQYAVNDSAVSLGIMDSLACLEAGLWDDAGRILSVHGQSPEPLLPRRIADAPLRLHLGFFGCGCCPDESAIFNVQEHREDRWVTRAGYVAAYRQRQRRNAQSLPLQCRFRYVFPHIHEAARASLATVRISIVQWVCGVGLLFMIWFTWAYLHQSR